MGYGEICSICGQEIPDRTRVFFMMMAEPNDQHYEDYTTLFYVCHKCYAAIVMSGLKEKDNKAR